MTAKARSAIQSGSNDGSPELSAPAPIEACFRAVFENSRDAIGVSRDGLHLFVNPAYRELFGYSPDAELAGTPIADLIAPNSRDQFSEYLACEASRALAPSTLETRGLRIDGSEFDMEANVSRYQENGEDHVLVILRDITRRKMAEEVFAERKRSELALKQSEERFKAIMTTAYDAILLMDDKGKFVYWNPAAENMFGYSAAESREKDLHLLLTPHRLHKNYLKDFEKFVRTGQGSIIQRSVELMAVKKDGTEFPIEISTSAMNFGGRWHALGIVRDITERKRAEEALLENRARLDLALQSAHMGVWRWEIRENRRFFDELTCQLLGIEAATFTGTAEEFFRVVHPEDWKKIKTALARTIERDVPYEPEYRVVWRDGSVHHITARGRLVRDEKGHPVRINGIVWDITDRRLLEEERLKAQKLESIGTLAGGIAHDFNNLLQGLFGYIAMAKLTHDRKEKSLAMLEQAEQAIHQSVNLTRQLLTFSKGGRPMKKAIALQPVIENSVRFALSGSRVMAKVAIDDDLRTIDADEGQIGQVIQNIVLNAEQAMPFGGMIAIAARNVPASSVAGVEASSGFLVEISISDQGTGIPPEHLQRIFDPYFTTKDKGSGLGLATSYSIIRNHGGAITVSSEVGRGSLFTIILPALSARPARPAPVAVSITRRRGGRVLVMDDEALIRAVAAELLREIGYDAVFVERGEAAIQMYQEADMMGRPFDLVILDLTVRGGMGGLETVRILREIDPGVKAVVSSGYSEDEAVFDYRESGFQAVLNKPYTVENLHAVLNELMGDP